MYSSGIEHGALLEHRCPVRHVEERQHDPPHLARDRRPHVGPVDDARLHEGVAEAARPIGAHQRGDALELLLGDPAVQHQRLAEPVAAQVARGEHQPTVVEEQDLDDTPGPHLEVAAAALGGEPPDRLGDRARGHVREHEPSLFCTRPRGRQAPAERPSDSRGRPPRMTLRLSGAGPRVRARRGYPNAEPGAMRRPTGGRFPS